MALEFVRVIDYEDSSNYIKIYHYELLGPTQCFNLNGRVLDSRPGQESKPPSGHAAFGPSRYLKVHESAFPFMDPRFLMESD
jgi:hypothetical protein